MGVCCSTSAKQTSASSSRHYVSVSSSPSLFPPGNEYKQDSAKANSLQFEKAPETASVKETETNADSMWIESREETGKQHRKVKKLLENNSQQVNYWTGSVEKWSEESSTESDEGGNKVMASKPRVSGAIQRLKKKDSTRQPKYKDEIMLSDNIDSIVEKEIPEVPDETQDHIPAAESNGRNSSGSGATPRPSAKRNRKKGDNKLARDIDYILSDGEHDRKSIGASSSSSSVTPRRPKKSSRGKKKNEDKKLVIGQHYSGLQMQSDSSASSGTNTASSSSGTGLIQHIPTAESNGKISPAAVSRTEEARRLKRRQRKKKKETKLNDDVEGILKDDIPAPESNSQECPDTVSPNDFQKQNQKEDKLSLENSNASNGQISSILGTLPPPQKVDFTRKHNTQTDTQLNNDISYILNDDIFTAESNDVISSSPVDMTRPKTSNPKLTLAMDMDRILDPASIVSTTSVVPHQKKDSLSIANQEDELVRKINNKPIPLSSGAARRRKKVSFPNPTPDDILTGQTVKGSFDRPVPSSSEAVQRSTKNPPTTKHMTILEEVTESVEIDSNASMVSTGPVSQIKSHSSSSLDTAQRPKTQHTRSKQNTEDNALSTFVKEDLNTAESNRPILYSSGVIPRPKTRNPKLALAMKTGKVQGSSPRASTCRAVPRPKQDFLPGQATYTLPKDGSVREDFDLNIPIRSSAVSQSPNEKEDINLDDAINEILEIPTLDSGASVEKTPDVGTLSKDREDINLDEAINKILEIPTLDSGVSVEKISDVGTRSKREHSTKKLTPGEDISLDEAINEILEVPTLDSGASVRNISGTRSKREHSTQKFSPGEDINLDEAINEILEIPTLDSGSSVRNISGTRSKREKSTKKLTPGEDINLDEAINEILEIPTLSSEDSVQGLSDSDRKQSNQRSRMGSERKTKPSRKAATGESRGIDIKKPTAQPHTDTAVPDASASSSSIETKNCDSGCSIASGNTSRPMAAGLSLGCPAPFDTIKLPSSDTTRQQGCYPKGRGKLPPILLKEESNLQKLRRRATRETGAPALGSLQSMATHSKIAAPITGRNSTPSNEIAYKSDGLELMEQILDKEESTVEKPRIRASRETAAAGTGRNSPKNSSEIVYQSDELELMDEILVKEESNVQITRMGPNRVRKHGSVQSTATHRKAATPVTARNSPKICSKIVHHFAELELMDQILVKKESKPRMKPNRKAAVPVTARNSPKISSEIVHHFAELELMDQNLVKEESKVHKPRMKPNRKPAVPVTGKKSPKTCSENVYKSDELELTYQQIQNKNENKP
ncbi:hypothetical protein OS493_003202 [Desmophyllum pertusum]|uniref:Uncharacterized protein n=1 Tax=Desmophyllum pertusum TaxID=174260 RepID=A0A9W9YGN4_9CNID|nr:hypothetical protein OS493_003202 [Desmophyllum pertusum]